MRTRASIVSTLMSLTALLLASVSFAAAPAAPAKQPDPSPELRTKLAAKLPGAKPDDVRATPVAGLYEISLGGSIGYITADGKYLISGDLYDVGSKVNLTEARHNETRQRTLAQLKDSDLIVFSPVGEPKHTITVFTDVDCGYCRKLHSEIAEINKLGIRVRYAAYPRSGPGTESWSKIEAVWCAKDRRAALTRAKLGEDPGMPKCGANPVASLYEKGEGMGVRGTPAIFTETGEYVSGYLPAQKLAQYLDELKLPPEKRAQVTE